MIEYRFPEEKSVLLHYADILNDHIAKKIFLKGYVENAEEADALTSFYWQMVDQCLEDQGKGIAVLESEGVEAWLEYIFHSLNGYMVSSGYANHWDQE